MSKSMAHVPQTTSDVPGHQDVALIQEGCAEIAVLTEGYEPGDQFVMYHRIGPSWEARLIFVSGLLGPMAIRVGSGRTKWAASRAMRRAPLQRW